MPMSNRRAIFSFAILAMLVCLCWFAIGCGADDDPDVEATTAAVAAELSATRGTHDPVVASATGAGSAAAGSSGGPAPSAGSTSAGGGEAATSGAVAAPGPTAAPEVRSAPEPLAPLPISNPDALLASVSEPERACMTERATLEQLAILARSPELASAEERQVLLGCLEDDTTLQLFLTPMLSATGPLSEESSACLRAGYGGTDLGALMLAASGEPAVNPDAESAMAMAMVSFMVSLSCLSEEEFSAAAPSLGVSPEEYENFQCVLREVGGPEGMAALIQQGDGFPAPLFDAAFACQVEVAGSPPG